MISRSTFAGTLAAAALGAGAAPAFAQPRALRLATAPDEDAVACLYAQQAGIFRRNGLDVSVAAMASGSAITAAVAGGAIELGKASLLGLCGAHARGVPVTLIAPAAVYDAEAPVTGTLVRADSGINTARDLSGKTISVQSLRGQTQIATMAWIDQHGGDSSTVKFVELPPPAAGQALESGRVDAATLANPSFNEILETKKARILGWTSESIGRRYLIAAYFCTVDFARRNAEVAGRFARSIQEAAAYTNGHRADTVDLVARFTGIKPESIVRMTRVTCGLALDPAQIQPQIDIAVKYKVIAERFEARDLIDPGAARALEGR